MFLKIFFRSIRNQLGYFLIKITGLSLALMLGILVFLFAKSELGYDRFHKNADQIYRVSTFIGFRGGMIAEGSPFLLAESLEQDVPAIDKTSHLVYIGRIEVSNGIQTHTTELNLAGPDFLEMFNFKMDKGDGIGALTDPNSVIISKALARQVYGSINPLDQSLSIHLGQEKKIFKVAAVADDVPENSSIVFDLLVSDRNANLFMGESNVKSWTPFKSNVVTFFSKRDDAVEQQLVDGLNEIAESHGIPSRLNSASEKEKFPIMKLTDVHFENNADIAFLKEKGNLNYLYVLTSVAILILLVAAMNFANLSLGLSVIRSKEIGVRKVLGSTKQNLRRQFMFESFATTLISLIIGVVAAYVYLPSFNDLLNKELSFNFIENPSSILLIVLIGVITSVLSGAYPAYFISSQQVITSLKGKVSLKHKWLPNTITVFQFGISMLLIIVSLIMQSQLRHMTNYDLGFDKEHLIYQTFDYSKSPSDMEVKRFTEEAMKFPGVLGVSGTRGGLIDNEDETLWSVQKNGETLSIPSVKVGYDFIPMMGIELREGRNFQESSPADADAIIVNQAFVDVLELSDPIGNTVDLGNVKPVILGVVDNFRFNSLRTPVRPLILNLRLGSVNTSILTRIDGNLMAEALGHLKKSWEELGMKHPIYDYNFFEEDIERQYEAEASFKSVISYASFFAIVTALIGMIGLTSLNITRRVKEISLRRVLGAKMLDVLSLFMKGTGKLLFISAVLFWPIAYFYLENWLNDFNVRAFQNPVVYLAIGALITMITAILIFLVVRKTSLEDPAKVMRSE
jgi:putative ABC transport system permease protein